MSDTVQTIQRVFAQHPWQPKYILSGCVLTGLHGCRSVSAAERMRFALVASLRLERGACKVNGNEAKRGARGPPNCHRRPCSGVPARWQRVLARSSPRPPVHALARAPMPLPPPHGLPCLCYLSAGRSLLTANELRGSNTNEGGWVRRRSEAGVGCSR